MIALPLIIALRLQDAVLPIPVCMPAFDAHQFAQDIPAPRVARVAWVLINAPCGDF